MGNYNAIEDIKPDHTYVVISAQKGWPLSKSVDVVSLDELIDRVGRKSQLLLPVSFYPRKGNRDKCALNP